MIPAIVKFYGGGNVPIFQNSGSIPEIEPSTVVGASPETMSFFDDFANRYEKYHGKNIREKVRRRVFNDKPEIFNKDGVAGRYDKISDNIYLDPNINGNSYTHELTHKLNDSGRRRIRRSRSERRLLKEAYGHPTNMPSFMHKLLHSNKEMFTSNTELRRIISEDSGNLLGDALNTHIANLSDEKLAKFLSPEKLGYRFNAAYKPAVGITGEGLYYNVVGVNNDSELPEDMRWTTLSRKDQRYYNRMARRKRHPLINYNAYNSDRLAKIRHALINIA